MISRTAKALLTALIGVFALLVGLDNIIDYGTNFEFVRHVLSMDTTFPENKLMWRAITSEWVHHVAYWMIIAAELATGALCMAGATRLFAARIAPRRHFNACQGAGDRRPRRVASHFSSSAFLSSAANGFRCGNRKPGTDRRPRSASPHASASL